MTNYKVVSFSELNEELEITKGPIFCDTETIGFYGKVRLLQCYHIFWDEVLMVEWPEPMQLAAFVMKNHTVWHNAHYDITTIQQQTHSRLIPEKFDCTFLLARLAQPQYETYSLDDVIARVIGHDPYEALKLDKKGLQKSDWSKPSLTREQLVYAATDVKWMPKVWDAVKSALNESSYQLDISSVRSALDFQWNGMPVDSTRLNAEYTRIKAELDATPMPINANSYKQVRDWLNIDQSDAKFLSELELHGNEKAGAVIKVRKLRKLLMFLEKYDSERVYGKFLPSARSGRFTSKDHNLQQIPRALKCVFGHEPDSGRVLIYSDYAQLELRTICAILGVAKMEEMFRAGVDLHGYVASVLFGEDWTKQDRQVTKTYNFNLLYGGSVNMVLSILITYGLLVEKIKANRHKRKWLNMFSEINKWQQEQISKWRKGKLGSTPLGRKYKGKMMTDQMNIMNQGAGAEVAKLAMHYFCPWLKKFNEEHGTDVVLCDFIHDSYILSCPDDDKVYTVVARKLAECMQEAWFEMSKLFKIHDLPMPVDVSVGYNWGDIEDDKKDDLWKFQLDPYEMLAKVQEEQ